MKYTIRLITWINRFLMIPFIISILLIFINTDFYLVSACFAFVIGFVHILCALSTLFYINTFTQRLVRFITIYLSIVVLYFISYFLFFEFLKIQFRESVFPFIFGLAPIHLSLFWTYILESIKKRI